MAAVTVIAQTAEVALAAATVKTVVQVLAPANQRLRIKGWGVYFDGVASSGEPVQVELLRQTSAGTMTSLTPTRRTGTETIQSTALHTATVEPTAGDILDIAEVHPQTAYEVMYPYGEQPECAGGTRVGIRCTAPAIVNVRAKVIFEE